MSSRVAPRQKRSQHQCTYDQPPLPQCFVAKQVIDKPAESCIHSSNAGTWSVVHSATIFNHQIHHIINVSSATGRHRNCDSVVVAAPNGSATWVIIFLLSPTQTVPAIRHCTEEDHSWPVLYEREYGLWTASKAAESVNVIHDHFWQGGVWRGAATV